MSSLYSTRSAGPISLLYVEDDAINQEVLRTMLANVSDITLHIATDDTEAFELLGTLSTVPDVVLMDHHLGHITGVEVMDSMRAKYGDVFRFVLCTALSDAEAQELTRGARAMTFITKPYAAAEILDVVRSTAAKPAPSAAGGAAQRVSSGRATRSLGHSHASSQSSKHRKRAAAQAPARVPARAAGEMARRSGSNRRRPSGSSATDTSPSHHSGVAPQLGQHASEWLQHLANDHAAAPSHGSSSNVTYPTCSSAPGGHQSAPVQSIQPKVRPPEGASVSAATADEWARQTAKAMSDDHFSAATPPSALSSGLSQGDADARNVQHRALLHMRTGPMDAPNMAMVQPFHGAEGGGAAAARPDTLASPSFASASFSKVETAAVEAAAAAMAAAEPARRARSGTTSAHRSLTEVILKPDGSARQSQSGVSNELRRPDASGTGDGRKHGRRRGAGDSGHTNKVREREKGGKKHRDGKKAQGREHESSRSRKRNILRTQGAAAPDWTAQFVQALDGSNVHTIVSPDPNLHVQPPSSSGSPASFMGPRSTLQMMQQAHARDGAVPGAGAANSSGAAANASGSGSKNAQPETDAAVAAAAVGASNPRASLSFPDGANKLDAVSKAQLRKWFGSDPGDLRPGRTSYERLRDVLNALTDGSSTGIALESAPPSTTQSSGLQLTDDGGSPHAQSLSDLMRIHGRVDCGEQAVWGQRGKAAAAAPPQAPTKAPDAPPTRAPPPRAQPIPEETSALPIDVTQVPRLPTQQQASGAPGNSEYSSELSFKQQAALKQFTHSHKTRSRSSHHVSSHASRAAPPSGTDSDMPGSGTQVSSVPELHAASFRSADARDDLLGPRFTKAEIRTMVREINEATRVLSLPAARAQPPDVNISVWDLFTVLGFGEAAHLFTKSGITVADLSTMPAMRIMEHGLVVISQLDTLMYALSNL